MIALQEVQYSINRFIHILIHYKQFESGIIYGYVLDKVANLPDLHIVYKI